MKEIVIKSFNGIGDLLFVTPTLRRIKERYPDARISVNTNYPQLLDGNPYVDHVGTKNEGLFLGYPDPIHGREPTCHHIESDWRIVCEAYGLETEQPDLRPEIYCTDTVPAGARNGLVLVQTSHKGQWGGKKVWPYFKAFIDRYRHHEVYGIPHLGSMRSLVAQIARASCVVCAEGAISHIAKAMGTPAVVIFGGWCDPQWNGYQDHLNIVSKLECSYCYNARPCPNDLACYRIIDPHLVWRAVEEVRF